MQEFIALANRMADEAGEIVKKYYRQPFDVEAKSDETPVTIADRTIEQRLREIIEAERPQDGIFGEEFGRKDSENGLVWVLDPIDGTKPFITGRPTFGTLIALCEEDKPVLGLIDQAIVGDRWIGAKGGQSTHNGKPISTRKCSNFKNAVCSATSPGMFFDRPGFIERWKESCNFITWGGDCVSYGLLASGHMDVIIEADMQPYDYLAHIAIIEGAGGKICDFEGRPLSLNSGHEVVALGDESLWPEVEKLLRS